MKIRIEWPGVMVARQLREHVERQVGLALGRFGDGIGTVEVHFSSLGKKSQCRIQVALRVREVRVEDAHLDPLRAVDQAAARLSERVGLVLEHARN